MKWQILKFRGVPIGSHGLTVLMLFGFSSTVYSDPLIVELLIPDAPPLTFAHNVNGHGIVGDIVLTSIAKAGYIVDLKVLPWARAQRQVSKKQDILIAPLSRTPEREHQFTWIAPIMSMERAFFSLEHKVNSFEEAKKTYHLIGVGLGSAQEEILRSQGFSNEQIYQLGIGDQPAQMLLRGRIDAWFNGIPESQYIWSEVSHRELLMSPVMSEVNLYLACSKKCSALMVKQLSDAIESVHDDGVVERLREFYLVHQPIRKELHSSQRDIKNFHR